MPTVGTATGDADAATGTDTASAVTADQVETVLARYNQEFYDDALTFSVSFRGFKRRAGQYNPNTQEITISHHLLKQDPETVRALLKHELAHAAVHQLYDDRQKPHGTAWKQEMARMEIDDPDVTHDLQLVPYRYVFVCTGCGKEVGRHRKSKFVTQNDQYRCGDCGEQFEQATLSS